MQRNEISWGATKYPFLVTVIFKDNLYAEQIVTIGTTELRDSLKQEMQTHTKSGKIAELLMSRFDLFFTPEELDLPDHKVITLAESRIYD